MCILYVSSLLCYGNYSFRFYDLILHSRNDLEERLTVICCETPINCDSYEWGFPSTKNVDVDMYKLFSETKIHDDNNFI